MNPTIKIETLVDAVSKAAFIGEAAAFVGAGISTPSNLPTWAALLAPMAQGLDIVLKKDEDLPAVAQYIVNMAAGSRSSLISNFKSAIQRQKSKPSHYHHAIARSTIDLIWTTNYDTLLESAYAPITPRIHTHDMDIVHDHRRETVEIIKAHGCIDLSRPDELVITQEDFEDYFLKRPLIAERLRNDLQRKTFLFAGYGYGDPDIANILVEARRLAHKTPRQRYLLQKLADTKDGPDAQQRQKLWAMNLGRMGISCALVKSYEEYRTAMEAISLNSRGPTLYVTGSHLGASKVAGDVGKMLASQNDFFPVLLDGQSTGVSRSLIAEFIEAAAIGKVDFRDRLRFFPNPYAQVPQLSNDPTLLPTLREWRSPLLRMANTVLAFDGGIGTTAEVELAAELGCNIILVPGEKTGSTSQLMHKPSVRARLPEASWYMDKLQGNQQLSPKEIVELVCNRMPKWTSW